MEIKGGISCKVLSKYLPHLGYVVEIRYCDAYSQVFSLADLTSFYWVLCWSAWAAISKHHRLGGGRQHPEIGDSHSGGWGLEGSTLLPSEGPLHGLQMATFLLCPCLVEKTLSCSVSFAPPPLSVHHSLPLSLPSSATNPMLEPCPSS